MSRRGRLVAGSAATIIAALLAALLTWVWFDRMEQGWQARFQESEQLRDNPMLAATQLLQAHHYAVHAVPTLDDALRGPLPDGTLLVADQGGEMTPQQLAQLLRWVARGNTLITVPQWAPRLAPSSPDSRVAPAPPVRAGGRAPLAPLLEADLLGARYGLSLSYHNKVRHNCDDSDAPVPARHKPNDDSDNNDDDDAGKQPAPGGWRHIACLTLQTAYPLELETDNTALDAGTYAPQPLLSDSDGLAVRGYAEGRGLVVFMAHPYFGHTELRRYDHAELLLALARLHADTNTGASQFTIVRHLLVSTWYGALWRAAWPFLCPLALLLSLLLWRALRRFGPLLPEAAAPRRALLEHIDASGNWLWQATGGRELLLDAARRLTDDTLRRRAPALAMLELPQRIAELARLHDFSPADLQLALADAPARRPQLFTRQIELLQQLRTHYER